MEARHEARLISTGLSGQLRKRTLAAATIRQMGRSASTFVVNLGRPRRSGLS
jgi:hypothetical protein